MIQGPVELIHSAGAEGVAHLRAVEGDPHSRQVAEDRTVGVALHAPVIGDVLEVEALHRAPLAGVEEVGYLLRKFAGAHCASLSTCPLCALR